MKTETKKGKFLRSVWQDRFIAIFSIVGFVLFWYFLMSYDIIHLMYRFSEMGDQIQMEEDAQYEEYLEGTKDLEEIEFPFPVDVFSAIIATVIWFVVNLFVVIPMFLRRVLLFNARRERLSRSMKISFKTTVFLWLQATLLMAIVPMLPFWAMALCEYYRVV